MRYAERTGVKARLGDGAQLAGGQIVDVKTGARLVDITASVVAIGIFVADVKLALGANVSQRLRKLLRSDENTSELQSHSEIS